jgi:hypothetical protein
VIAPVQTPWRGAGGELMTLQRLVLTFKPDGPEVCTLYRTTAGAGPSTKARRREVTTLVRTGLEQALEALEGRVEVVGTSGHEVREDTLSAAGRAA